MTKINTVQELRETISLLEIKQSHELDLLKEQFKVTYESLKPVNLIGNTIKELTTQTNLKGHLLNSALGLAAGYLTKKATIGNTHNPIKQLLGTFLQMGVTNLVAKNGDSIKSFGHGLLNQLLRKKKPD